MGFMSKTFVGCLPFWSEIILTIEFVSSIITLHTHVQQGGQVIYWSAKGGGGGGGVGQGLFC